MKRLQRLLTLLALCTPLCVNAQREYTPSATTPVAWNTPGNLNPFIPGYFADPTIRKFGDTYYIYATTDGTGNGYGPAQVWVSKDFQNWKNVILNWPTTEVVWAPDVVQQPDGTFRYFYCEPCNVNVGVSQSPLGPWHNLLGKSDAVMVPDRFVHNAITLDPQLFRDDDGSEYLYFTTWAIYDGFGCGCAKLNKDWTVEDIDASLADARHWNEGNPFPIQADKFFSEKRLIPNTELKDIFEAPFVFKRNGIYYFTYSSGSCHTDTYRVQYATSTVGPMGPFTYQGELLTTNEDGTVHGPGHHSILQDGDHYYIVYHRHDIAKAIHGFNRQVCMDELHFNDDGTIQRVTPTHSGLLPASLETTLKKRQKSQPQNLAFGATATASSYYSEQFKPAYAVDDNNATLWKAAHCSGFTGEYLQLDLGKVQRFNQIWTQFEYATFFYQYRIMTSQDGQTWQTYANREDNVNAGSPMIDKGQTEARYIRIYITDTQKNGHFPAIWNVKVYNATKKNDPTLLLPNTDGIDYSAVEAGYPRLHKKDVEPTDREQARKRDFKVVDINADDYAQQTSHATREIKNRCGGAFSGSEDIVVEVMKGKWAFYFDGQSHLKSDFHLPRTMTYNAPYTIAAWVYNPSVEGEETMLECTERRNDLSTIEFRNGLDPQSGLVAHNASFENFGDPQACRKAEGSWHHWVDTYDGYMERIYLDGKLLREKNSFLMIRPEGRLTLGSSFDGAHPFSGYLHNLQLFDQPYTAKMIQSLYDTPSDTQDKVTFDTSNLKATATALTPTLAKVAVTDADGQPIHSGRLRYQCGTTTSTQPEFITAIDTPEDNESTDKTGKAGKTGKTGKTRKTGKIQKASQSALLQVAVLGDEGDTITVLTATLPNDASFTTFSKPEETTLSATTPNFNEDPAANGAQLLTEATGDFVMQCRVVDMEGQDRHRTPAYNEGGIIIVGDASRFIQLGVFPNYNCGNMLTLVSPEDGRPQFPNQKGWQYDSWLQLERSGNFIYARTSADGKTWANMSGSPIEVSKVLDNTGASGIAGNTGASGIAGQSGQSGNALRLGLYQTTYTDHKSWVKFTDFNVWKR